MNVLMLNNEFPPLGGGTATVNANLLDALSNDKSLSITLVTSSGGASASVTDYGANSRIHRVKVKRQASPHHASVLDLLSFIFSALPYCIKLHRQQKFDLIFAWATLPAGLVAWLLGRFLGIPYIVRVSGPDIPGWEKRYSTLTKILAPLIRMIWRRAAITTAKSEQERAAVLENCPGLTVLLLPTAVPSVNREPRKRATGCVKFLCVARLIGRKRHELLLRSLALLPSHLDWSISIVGTGDEEDHLKQVTKSLTLENRVTFFGYVTRTDVNQIYRDHDIFISLSENESMCVAALEALASGMPCLLSPSAAYGLPEIPDISLLHSSDQKEISVEIFKALSSQISHQAAPPKSILSPEDMADLYKRAMSSVLQTTQHPN